MKCPICTTIDLLMTERMNIEIDYCPQCRGVWLDRGELDKIIAHSVAETTQAMPTAAPRQAPPPMQPMPPMPPQVGAPPWGYRDDHHDRHRDEHRGKKSIWRELFD